MGIGGALKRVFSKVGKGLTTPEAVAGFETVAPYIPIPGAALAAALLRVTQAEELFRKEPKSGKTKKKPWATNKLEGDLRRMGLQEKRLEALVEIALLMLKAEARVNNGEPEPEVAEDDPPKSDGKEPKTKDKPKGKAPKGGKGKKAEEKKLESDSKPEGDGAKEGDGPESGDEPKE